MLLAEPISSALRRRTVAPSEFTTIVRSHEIAISGRTLGNQIQARCITAQGMRCDNRRLMDVDFSGSDLSRTTFLGTDLTRAVLPDTLLAQCDFRGAILRKADLSRANLSGAQLSGAVLDDADLRGAVLASPDEDLSRQLSRFCANLKGSSLDNAQLDEMTARGVDFTGCSMRGARLRNADFTGANFADANLDGADLSGSELAGVNLQGAILTGVDIEALGLPSETLSGCVRDPSQAAYARAADIRGIIDAAVTWVETSGAAGARGRLEDMDIRVVGDAFRTRALAGLYAPRAVGVAVDFTGSQLQGANFDGADLRRADFRGADLRGASFIGANLTHARLGDAHVGSLTLPDGRELPARFDGARIEGSGLKSAA
jgi:uncharacterized protein YjbI with pentapeptide repeats